MTLDNKWYGNCKKRGHCRLNFLHQCSQSREGTQQYLIGLHQVSCTLIWLQVIVFWGPYRFTSFGVLSQHNWTLLYQSSLRLFWPHLIWIADKILMPCANYGIMVVPYRLWGFQYSRRYHKWGIGIGSSPIGYEGFVQPQKGQGEARLNE